MLSLFITYVITISNVVNLFPDTILKLCKLYLKSIQTLLIIYVTIKDFSVLCASNHMQLPFTYYVNCYLKPMQIL